MPYSAIWLSPSNLAYNTRKEEKDRIAAYLATKAAAIRAGESSRLRLLGGALERAGHHVYALEFYERVFRRKETAWSPEDVSFAEQRWVKCKKRQASWSREAGKISDARNQEAEVEAKLRTLGITFNSISDWPRVMTAPSAQSARSDSGPYRPEVSTPAQSPAYEVASNMMEVIFALLAQNWPVEKVASSLNLSTAAVERVIAGSVDTYNHSDNQ